MEVKINQNRISVQFGKLLTGEVFVWDTKAYVKLSHDSAVPLGGKFSTEFNNGTEVIMAQKIELTI